MQSPNVSSTDAWVTDSSPLKATENLISLKCVFSISGNRTTLPECTLYTGKVCVTRNMYDRSGSFQLTAAFRSFQKFILTAVLVIGGSHASSEDAIEMFGGAAAVAATETRTAVTIGDSGDNIQALVAKVDQLASKVEDITRNIQLILVAAGAVTEGAEGIPRLDERVRPPRINPPGNDREEELLETEADLQPLLGREGRKWGGRNDGGSWVGSSLGGGFRGFGSTWWALLIFVHEVWVCLQHANVLLNPLCQRLDRGYGIALLKRRLYWVIAIVLAAYWAREVLSMLLAVPYSSPLTRKMITVSVVYHVGKILLISVDANRGWSPPFGMMRLLIDHWHLASLGDMLVSAKRMALQGFDTVTHALIIRDMMRWDEEEASELGMGLSRILLVVAAIWAVHAIANIATKKSTATLVVELAKTLVRYWGYAGATHGISKYSTIEEGETPYGAQDGGRADVVCTFSCSPGHKRCEVCYLLTRDMPPSAVATMERRKRVD